MSIDALITGRLVGQPQQRTSKNGKPFTTCKARIPTGDDSLFCNVICFDQATQAALLALDGGEAVSLAGELKVGIWQAQDGTTRPSLDMTAHALLTTHHVRRKRQAMQPEQEAALADRRKRPQGRRIDAWTSSVSNGGSEQRQPHRRDDYDPGGLDDGAPLDF
jgi:single-stranded DNA-binding protein